MGANRLGKRRPVLRTLVIGRSPYADVVLADTSVDRRHAELVLTADGRYFLTDCATKSGTWHCLGEEQGRERWQKVRQCFVGGEDALRLGDHRCTVGELLEGLEVETGNGTQGRWRGEPGRDGSNEMPRGRVERDPRTGEIVPKRL